ncbi:MAG: cytochrome-c oxidase, cbb3-type subunit III [Betaproteobacteria bacterium]|nr:cytochrome-c oxidase, cbb3-type subunit III [Betaproteobacteria bacterium]
MSDFVSEFWNLYVVVIVLVSIIGCGVLLKSQSVHKGSSDTTGHVWDETLAEYNNPLPAWWSWMFYLTIVFALAYLTLYPGLGKFQGVLGWSSAGQYNGEMKKANDTYGPIYDKYLKMDLKAVAADKEANEMGKRLFLTYCSQCHGSDARGAKGFPNLTDSDWQWGGDPETVKTTIMEGRNGVMPSHAQLGEESIKDLANFVRSLSGLPHDSVRAAKGKETFQSAGCVGCHGPEAHGTPALGAPNLTDKTWLYGSSEATIIETITKGRNNRMPAWKDFLGEAKVHLLAAYVLSLSGTDKK